MNSELLKCTPTKVFCPLCGEWHKWTGGELEKYTYLKPIVFKECNPHQNPIAHSITAFFDDKGCYLSVDLCRSSKESFFRQTIPFDSFHKIDSKSASTITFLYTMLNFACSCTNIQFGFEFDKSDYDQYSYVGISRKEAVEDSQCMEQCSQEQECDSQCMEQSPQECRTLNNINEQAQIKEEPNMSKTTMNGTSIKTLLYEKSPKENFELLKTWADKYKPVLKWTVPVVAVYAAYRILNSKNSDLSVNNVAETCEKILGFKITLLENQKALKELMALGGIATVAYGSIKLISSFIGTNNEENEISADISVEQVEEKMTQLESISKKFSFLQPTTENMLPIALSVILVYTALHKPRFNGKFSKKVHNLTEDFQAKVDVYCNLAKGFIQDKFNIDLSDEAEQKKMKICVFLLGIMGVFAFLYGKKVLSNKFTSKDDNAEVFKSATVFVEQAKDILNKLAPTLYTSLITFLVSKKLLSLEEEQVFSDGITTEEADHRPAGYKAVANAENTSNNESSEVFAD